MLNSLLKFSHLCNFQTEKVCKRVENPCRIVIWGIRSFYFRFLFFQFEMSVRVCFLSLRLQLNIYLFHNLLMHQSQKAEKSTNEMNKTNFVFFLFGWLNLNWCVFFMFFELIAYSFNNEEKKIWFKHLDIYCQYKC